MVAHNRLRRSWHARTDIEAVVDWITAGFGQTHDQRSGQYTRYAYWRVVPGGWVETIAGTGVTRRRWIEEVSVLPTADGMPPIDWLASHLRGDELLTYLAGIACVTRSGDVARVTLTDPGVWDSSDPHHLHGDDGRIEWVPSSTLVALLFG